MTLLHDQPTTSLPPDTATPAPTGPWRVLVEWARGQDCLGDLLLIAYSMHCERNPEWMGSVLWPLGQPANLDLLVRWAAELPELQPLHAVGQCVACLDAGVQDVIPAPLPPEVPPEQQLRGYLKFNYLLAACIDRPPQPKDKSRSDAVALWFTKVRLWLLGQALIRAQRSNRLDTNIKIVADALRLASSRKPDWLALVSALLAPLPTDFDSISQSLRRRSQECLNKQDCLLGAAQREALHAIARIARNEDAPFGLDDERKMELPPIFRKVRPEPVRPDNLSLPLSDDSDVGLLIEVGDVSTGAEEERRAVYTGDEFATQQERKAVGRTILLHASEAAQFLPWSWHQLTDDETASITGWLRREECRGDADALLAAMVWTALSTGYSLLQTVRFPLADELGRDWSISRDCETLQRIVPRPAYKTALSMEQLAVLEPLAGTHVVTLPIWVQRTFKQAAPASGGTACELIDLWKSADETPEQAYRRVATQHGFGRVTPGMLGKHLAYTLYRESGDGLFAWMASVHGRTALPGASAYPSWRGSELTSRFGVAGIGITVPDGQERNALGSRLRPVEFELSAVLQRGLDRLGCMASAGSIAERHNAYTCSLVLHLLVATGARPIVDPFESPLYFDLNLHRVFVSDKLVSTEEGGRLVPLPEAVAKLIGRYCDYLRDLSATLQGSRPHLGHSIRCLVERTAPFSMPFFFFMNGSASDWESISEDGIKRLMATEMALPLNVFRHRLSSRLRECGVDPELIDGLLGHAYSDCESYGDLSLRCWEKDMESVIPHLNELYAQLGLREPYPPECPTQEGIGQLSSCVTTAGTQRLFGIARRLHDQRLRRAEARKQARQMVEDWIGNRKLEDIQQSDLEPILRALTTTPNGMPHRLANIRYDVLRRFIEQSKRGGRSKLRLSRVDMSLNEDRPMAQASAVIASPTISILLNALPDLRKQYPPGSGKVADAQFMASLHLLVESRIADPRIHSVVGNKKALRLVLYGQRYWIEYVGTEGYDDEEEAGWGIGPVLRYPISVDAATYLRDGWCDGRGTTVIHKAVWRILKATGYPSVGEANGDRTLSLLRELVDQHNRLGMPGVLAGVLAGRISACSLDHHDWIRLETGEILAPSHPEELLNAGFIELDGASGGNVTKEPDARSVLQNDARSYFRELRLILDQGTITDKKSKARRELCRSIKKTLEGYRGKVSSALLILGEWLEHLARTVNRVRSVMRYLNSLSGAAAEVWYDEDLLLADEDEVTAVYARLLEARPDRDLRTVGLHLRRFHAFARSEFALPEPDWAELPLPPESVSIRPAYLREADYHAALTALQSQELPQDYVTAGSMLLLLAYRYGLRVAEALGLSRGDWLGEAEPLIRVQNNALRKLKTPAGRRLVPTLFTLSDLEKSIIERVLLSAEAMHGDRTSAPLLGVAATDKDAARRIRLLVIEVLRLVTGSPSMVLHGARHSYAARVLDALLAAGAPGYQGRLDVTPDVRIPLHLLGTRCATRRALWGLAKLIGHASPATTVCSYTHLLDRLVNDYVAPSVLRHVDGKGLEGVINLDAMARLAVERKQRLDSSPTSALRLGSLIRFARLLSRGVSVSRAAAAFDLDVPTASLLNLALEWCFKTSARRKDRDLPLPILMATVTEGQWAGLIDYVDQPRDRSDIVWIKNPTPQEIASLFGPQRHLVLWREEHYQWAGALIDYIQLPKGKLKLYATSQETESQKKWVMQYRLESLRELEASPLQLDTVKTDGGTSIVVGRSVLVLAEGRDHPIGNRILLMIFAVCWFLAGQK